MDQLDDSQLVKQSYISFIEEMFNNKMVFKGALAFQEIVMQRYETFYLQLYADYSLHQKKVSDGAVNYANGFFEDTEAYVELAKKFAKVS
jgi:hypothetical protein